MVRALELITLYPELVPDHLFLFDFLLDRPGVTIIKVLPSHLAEAAVDVKDLLVVVTLQGLPNFGHLLGDPGVKEG